MDRTRMVAIRKTVPSTIRTKGPARDRCRRGGGGITGGTPGVMTGLDMVHLARRGRLIRILRCWRRDRRWNRRHSIRWNTGRRDRRPQANVSVVGGIALHQLDYSNHQQYGGPRSAKSQAGDADKERKYTPENPPSTA